MKRDQIVEIGYELAKEITWDGGTIGIMVCQILQEFTRKLADKLVAEPCTCKNCQAVRETEANVRAAKLYMGKTFNALTLQDIQKAMADLLAGKPKSQLARALAVYGRRNEYKGDLKTAIICLDAASYELSDEVVAYAADHGFIDDLANKGEG